LVFLIFLSLSLLGHSFAHAMLQKLYFHNYTDIPAFLKSNRIENLEDYVRWLQEHVTYASDADKDDWADPLITLNKQTGDCEDIAFLNAEVLKHFGYEPQVLAYGHGKEAHVICLFIKDGKYYIFDNTKFYREITSPSLKEIFKFLSQKHEAEFLLQLDRNPKKLTVLFTNIKQPA